ARARTAGRGDDQTDRGGWKTAVARRTGRGDEPSRPNDERGASAASPGSAHRTSSFTRGPTGLTGAGGGASRVGDSEQFGPWHGALTGAGASPGAAGVAWWPELGWPLRMVT